MVNKNIKKISIIISLYSERKTPIYRVISDLTKEIENKSINYEIIIVYDKTKNYINAQALKLKKDFKDIKFIVHDDNVGKEYAFLLEAIDHINSDVVVYFDPYSKLKLSQIWVLLGYLNKQSADIVIGSKRHPASKVKYSFTRKMASCLYYWLVDKLFDIKITDAQTGLKIYRYGALKNTISKLVTKKYAFDLELLVCAHNLGYKIVEAPVIIDETYRFKAITPPDFYHILIDTFAILYRLKILKYYSRTAPQIKVYPSVSILIAVKTYNKNLEECLKRCLELDYPDYEIIVLPDEEVKLNFPGVRVIATGNITPPKKRDIGIEAAKGDIVAFLDDDAMPKRNWIKAAVPYFEDERVAAVGGPAATPDNSSLRELASGAVYASRLVAWNNNYRYIPKVPMEVDDYPTCNLFVRKRDLEEIGGFGSKFWPGEDTIICQKITRELGKKIYYDPDVFVYHKRRPLFIPHLKQVASYALHRGYFVKRYPETSLRLSYFFPSFLVIGVSLGWILAVFFPVLGIIYFATIAIYLLWSLGISLCSVDLKMGALVFSGIIVTHFVYGIFFLKGLSSRKLREEDS